MSRHLIVTVGLPGSGKSTWADQRVAASTDTEQVTVVNRDHLRAMLRRPFPVDEYLVTIVQRAAVRTALRSGYTVIVDDTNLNPEHVEQWRQFAASEQVAFALVDNFLHTPLATVLEQSRARPQEQRLPDSVIIALRDQWLHAWPQLRKEPGVAELTDEEKAKLQEDIRKAVQAEKDKEDKAKEN